MEVQKRKLGEEGDDEAANSKRVAAAGDCVPTQMEVDASLQMKNEDFSPELLRIYYDRLFPFRSMFRWLSYGHNPKSSQRTVQKDFFLRREFTFVLQGDVYCRYMCFRDAEEYRAQVMSRQPVRMEIGAVYTHPPKNHNTVIKEAYKPIERELVFDIDMDDYDDIRTCCQGSKLCRKCWTFMTVALRTLDRALRQDFGFKHILFVYSGRRGMHCWVGDKTARQLSNEQRSAVAEYFNLITPGANRSRTEIKFNGCDEMHPSIQKACEICEAYFKDEKFGILRGQEILTQGPHLSNIMETMGATEKDAMNQFVANRPDASSRDIWQQLEKLQEDREKNAGSYKEKQNARVMLKEVLLQHTYPRLDINVSKQMNHLLKSPFVVHPKTGRVCVPIDPETVAHTIYGHSAQRTMNPTCHTAPSVFYHGSEQSSIGVIMTQLPTLSTQWGP